MYLYTVFPILLINRVTLLLACNSSEKRSERNDDHFLKMETVPPVIEPQNASDILKILFQNYDKTLRPKHAGEPLDITLSIGILSLSNIEEENMQFTADMYMRQIWNDTRLAFGDGGSALVLQGAALDDLWLPDTFFENAVNTFVQQETQIGVIFGDGLVIYSQRVTVEATTLMDFRAYPMDKQIFKLNIMSYGRGNNQMRYRRIDVELLNKEMSEFTVVRHTQDIMAKKYFMGCFDVLTVKVVVKRTLGYYVMRIFFPCTLCTVVSWIVFWMEPKLIGDRVTVGITSLLTQLFLVGSINEQMPRVSYVKAADVFLIVSFVFTFITILGSMIAYKAASTKTDTSKDSPDKQKGLEPAWNISEEANQDRDPARSKDTTRQGMGTKSRIDSIARVLFPAAFLVFVVIYAIVYMI